MVYLAVTLHFGYEDMMNMDQSEHIEFVKLASEHNKEQNKILRGK